MPSPSESSLENGLKVLKQGNFQRAIAILQAVATQEGNSNTGLQAQVGLVVAYARSGNIPQAISLCRSLTQSSNSQVNEWANSTLKQLAPGEVGKQGSEEAREQSKTNIPEYSPPLPAVRDKVKSLPIYWRRAGRAKSWQPLQKLNLVPLRLLIAGSFIALFWVLRELVVFVMRFINDILVRLPYLEPIQLLYANPTLFLLLVLLILMGSSPWLLDQLFVRFYDQRELRKEILNSYSPEAVRVLQRYCQQRGWQFPKLSILPTAVPVALTYGNLSRTARVVVSQGLLEQLEEDEIAVVYAHQLGHIAHWDFVVMSLVVLVTIPVYGAYHQFAKWGDTTQGKIWRLALATMASLAYGVWCLLALTSLWLSQLRQYYCDRVAVDITGNPNGLVRALLKIAIGIASDIQKQEHTNWQLESLNILAPVSYQQSICLGSIAPHTTFESFLMWDYLNPYRWWFVVNKTHPMMGDRLQRLVTVARCWRLEPELEIESQQPIRVRRQTFLFQIASLLGIILGVAFGVLIWVFWQLAYALKFLNLKWIYDGWSFLIGCLLIGFSIGILLRMNSFFPDLKSATLQTNERLPELLANPTALPVDSTGVYLVGKLLGRRGTSNFLGQDFILQSNTGLVKLHYIPLLGEQTNPQDLLGRQITITGWLRRGSTPWVDIHTLQTQSGKTIHSPHPIWSTVLAVASEAWGAYLLLRG
ncbi:MAG: zinc metalloprotease HtpX [Scytonema sp. PMC 1069.18]|nr:zinc metalloprotease HtpX [Scytonema sp. PMC 1069.18]MEC4885246.1 zinc metalloprotease HtpX [Scytonema sp. PMC 1070.18]